MPDMRDREGDALTGVRTIPVIIGIDRTERVLGMMNGTTALMVIAVAIGAALPSLISSPLCRNALLHPVSHYLVRRFGQPDLICDILLDGGFVIIGGAIVLAQILIPILF